MNASRIRKAVPAASGAQPRRGRGAARASLLREAVRLFSARGFDGVTVDEIVAAAAVNKRMVYHYFGSKEEIYRAALTHVFGQLADLEAGVIASHSAPVDPADGMRCLVEVYFSFLKDHPEFVRMLLWENLSEGRHLAKVESGLRKSAILDHVSRLLNEGIRSGQFRDGLDPRLVLTSLIGLCLVCFSNRFTLSQSVGIDFAKPSNLRRTAAHAAEFFIAALGR